MTERVRIDGLALLALTFALDAALALPIRFLERDLPLPENLSLVSRQQKRARQVIFVFIAAMVFLIACWLLI